MSLFYVEKQKIYCEGGLARNRGGGLLLDQNSI